MRILVAHNAYQQKGGEDSVMEAEVAMLAERGHSIELFLRHNDALHQTSAAKAAVQALWSSPVARDFEAVLRRFKPDLIHVHNTFPLISPAIYWVADRMGVPLVQTLHNFRLLCPQAMFLRQGRVCEDCLGKLPWRGVVRSCYRDSALQSAVLAGMLTLHRALGTWQHKVTRYIALNAFCRSKFVAGGIPAGLISIKPNFVDFAAPPENRRSGLLFVGRLSAEKGVKVLVDACRLAGVTEVRIAGSGPEASLISGIPGVRALGSLSGESVRLEMCQATALVLPSIWYENFPRTLVEAFACGLPVIASRIGALAELVDDGVTGLLFEPGDSQDLARQMRWAQQHPEKMAEMGRQARQRYEAEYTAERNYAQLMAIYQDAIQQSKDDT
jgi:glycosyltransferase involved in cell wall biosynthesis